MLSPKQAAQPNPSYPALRRQDITSPMEHRLRRKHLHLNSDTDAGNENIWKNKRKEETFFSKKDTKMAKHEKRTMKNMKAKSLPDGPLLTPHPHLVYRDPKVEFSLEEIVRFTTGIVRRDD